MEILHAVRLKPVQALTPILVVQTVKLMKVEATLFAAKLELYAQGSEEAIAALQVIHASQKVFVVLQVKYLILIVICAVIKMTVMGIAAFQVKHHVCKIGTEIMHDVVLMVVDMLVGRRGISVVECHVEGIMPIAIRPARPDILTFGG